jgi:hypothetical protein
MVGSGLRRAGRLAARPGSDGVRPEGNNIPSIITGVITLPRIGLNTYVVLSLATYCLSKLSMPAWPKCHRPVGCWLVSEARCEEARDA